MKFFTLVGLLCVVACAFGQDTESQSGLKKKTHAPVSTSTGAVTAAEAAATLNKMGGLLKTVLHVTVPTQKASGSRAETRSEVIEAFMSFYKAAEPAFVITPRPVAIDVPRLHADKPSVMPALQKLITKGCIAKYGPLATGKTTTLTVAQFGDAVGYFLSRIVEMTHSPSVKWSPYLHG